jgi:ubiquinone/menaquinone biosynthesis C-methylase UbiE
MALRLARTRTRTHLAHVCLAVSALAMVIAHAATFQQTPGANTTGPSTIAEWNAGDSYREPYQKATALLQVLGAIPGDWVSDVGTGSGYYSMRLSRVVGPEGKVFGEDISESSMRLLSARAKAFELLNLEIVKGDADDPKLPPNRLASILVVDTYHHFEQVQSMLSCLLHALKPGGRLVIADYLRPEDRSLGRADQVKRHEIDPGIVRVEAERAGFQFVSCDEQFLRRIPEAPHNARAFEADLWLMVAARPK